MVLPSISHVRPGSWQEVIKCADQSTRDALPPVILIEMKDHLRVLRLCLFDGNHRVLLTKAHGGYVVGLVFTIAEVRRIDDKQYDLNRNAMGAIRAGMIVANRYGIYTWDDLLSQVTQK